MILSAIFEQVRVGDSFFRESKPEILYERLGTRIERNGQGWAMLEGGTQYCKWQIDPEQRNEDDLRATDWTIRKGHLHESNPPVKYPKLKPLVTEKTRYGWTYYDQLEPPKIS
jgi:hypothetical protein